MSDQQRIMCWMRRSWAICCPWPAWNTSGVGYPGLYLTLLQDQGIELAWPRTHPV